MKPREFILSTGTKIYLGRDAENNDELVRSFKGKENIILHTIAPGSPFCVIEPVENRKPTKEEIYEAGIICAAKSQAWRDNKKDILIHKFTGKEVRKRLFSKKGSWKLTSNPKDIKIKKQDILKWEKAQKKTG